jgi:TRAP-type C4-dicarboxylate transport system permease small subunit
MNTRKPTLRNGDFYKTPSAACVEIVVKKILLLLIDIIANIQKASQKVNRAITVFCGGLAFLLMLLICTNIVGRYLFNAPVPGTLEIGESVIVFIIFLTLAYVQSRGGHFRVTILTTSLPEGLQSWLDLFAMAIGSVFSFCLAKKALGFALHSWDIREMNMVFPLPIYPAKFAYFAGCALLFAEFTLQVLRQIAVSLANTFNGEKMKDGIR